MSARVFNVFTGAIASLVICAGLGALAAVLRTCHSSELARLALTAAFVGGILVLGMLLGRSLLNPTRSTITAAAIWTLALAAAGCALASKMIECFNT